MIGRFIQHWKIEFLRIFEKETLLFIRQKRRMSGRIGKAMGNGRRMRRRKPERERRGEGLSDQKVNQGCPPQVAQGVLTGG